MKQHVIIAKVDDHGTITFFKKVCRSKSGAIKESRELASMKLIPRIETRMKKHDDGSVEWVFVPASQVKFSFSSGSDCSVSIHVEDMDGKCVNLNENSCFEWDRICETRDECNCDKVWPELARRGFVRA